LATQVLVTRAAEQAAATARRLAGMGFVPVLAPSLVVRSRRLAALPGVQAVLVTSGNAIPALPARLRKLRLLAVGDATAERAREAGFLSTESAGRDAASLAKLAARRLDPAFGPLLLASGEGQGMALAAELRQAGFRVLRRVAYTAAPARALPPAARAALAAGKIGHALFFSPASARATVRLLRGMPTTRIKALAISPATAAALSPLKWAGIRVASSPDQEALLALLPTSATPGGHAP
jgi:uroporphyrinogen-III synthase